MISIFLNDVLAQKGGPAGYIFNLQESIKINNEEKIRIISIDAPLNYSNKKKIKFDILKKIIPYYIKKEIIETKVKKSIEKRIDIISDSKIIHFHSTRDLYVYSKYFDSKDKKLLLTSHSPELPYEELRKNLIAKNINYKKINREVENQKNYDVYAFKRADKIIFPCEGAVDPYKKFFIENKISKEKLDYVLTGCEKLKFNLNRFDFCDKYKIPANRKIIAFIGRHNEIKGFDIFCKIAEYFSSDDRYFFVCAGVGEIKVPEINNLKDIGWTNDPGSLANAASIIVVPNRETYFDIGIIQYLSLGKVVLTTKTGGNKWFVGKTEDILFADDNFLTYVNIINDNVINEFSEKNMRLYNEFFRIEKFSENYMKLYSKYLGRFNTEVQQP